MTSRNSTWGAVVIRPQLSWFARVSDDAPTSMHAPTPEFARTNLPRVVRAAGTLWFPRGGEGTVLWQCDDTVDTYLMVEQLRADGYKVSDSGHDFGWFTVRRDGHATVHLGIGKMISPSRFPIATLDEEARAIALRLVEYADRTGAAWRGAAGMNGCAQIRAQHESKPSGAQPLWRWDDAKSADAIRCSFELRGNRERRQIEPEELRCAWVYQFDVSAMYVAAANVAMVGWSAPEQRGAQEFDPARPGYWQVRRDELADVPIQLVRPGVTPLVWLTTPVMAYLAEVGRYPEVMDSWTSERGGRYLKTWAERLTAALKTVAPAPAPGAPSVERALKDTYKRTVGMLAKEGGRIFRPDWRDEIVDRARVNLLRKCAGPELMRPQRWKVRPLRYQLDSVWIASNEPPEVVGHAIGVPYDDRGAEVWQVGKFRLVDRLTPAEYAARYERDRVPV